MPQPFAVQRGRIRLSPLQEAVASAKSSSQGNGPSANRSSANQSGGGVGDISTPKLPEGVTPEQVADAKAKAAAGDQDAIDWLKTLGLLGGAAAGIAGGAALYNAVKNRKPKPKTMGADKIATDAATANSSRAVAKAAPKKPDLYIDLPETEYTVRSGYLDNPIPKLPAPTQPAITKESYNVLRALRRIP